VHIFHTFSEEKRNEIILSDIFLLTFTFIDKNHFHFPIFFPGKVTYRYTADLISVELIMYKIFNSFPKTNNIYTNGSFTMYAGCTYLTGNTRVTIITFLRSVYVLYNRNVCLSHWFGYQAHRIIRYVCMILVRSSVLGTHVYNKTACDSLWWFLFHKTILQGYARW